MSAPNGNPSVEPSPLAPPALSPGSPMPSFFRVLRSDTPTNTFSVLPVALWFCWLLMWGCWLLASIGIDLAGLGAAGVAGLLTAQRWFLLAALAVSAVCVPLLLRRMLVIRGIFTYPAEVDGQVVHVPPRSGWKTLIVEYGYRGEKHRLGYTVPNASHPDQRLQVGDSVRLLVNERSPRHAIPLSMFAGQPAHPLPDPPRAAVARKEDSLEKPARTNRLAVASLVLALFPLVSCLLLLALGGILPDSFSAPPGHSSVLLSPAAWVFYLVAAADCLLIPVALLAGVLALTQISGSGGGQKGKVLAWSAIGLTVALLACWALSVVLPMILLPLLAALGQAP